MFSTNNTDTSGYRYPLTKMAFQLSSSILNDQTASFIQIALVVVKKTNQRQTIFERAGIGELGRNNLPARFADIAVGIISFIDSGHGHPLMELIKKETIAFIYHLVVPVDETPFPVNLDPGQTLFEKTGILIFARNHSLARLVDEADFPTPS